jgi:hypothetical protein
VKPSYVTDGGGGGTVNAAVIMMKKMALEVTGTNARV